MFTITPFAQGSTGCREMTRQVLQTFRSAFSAFTLTCCLTLAPAAQADPVARAMLVLDGSNSMWGQIDGTAKIEIAQTVVRDLLRDLPPELELGLAAYGHRRVGDCSDVEILVSPNSGNRDQISQRVGDIKPTGKTPMAAAVVQAAKALRHTDAPATVILVSDGVETCAPDVCQVARELEKTGVDFTAHVIGFDVTAEEAHTQFSCVANATGGRYVPVSSAKDLSAALMATTQYDTSRFHSSETSLPLITQSGRLYFVASHKMRGRLQNLPAHWQVLDQSGAAVMTGFHRSGGQIDLKPGSYQLIATDVDTGHKEARDINVTNGGSMQITLMFH